MSDQELQTLDKLEMYLHTLALSICFRENISTSKHGKPAPTWLLIDRIRSAQKEKA